MLGSEFAAVATWGVYLEIKEIKESGCVALWDFLWKGNRLRDSFSLCYDGYGPYSGHGIYDG